MTWIDSSGIGLFIHLKVNYKNKIKFRVFGLRSSLQELFHLTNLDAFIDINATEEEGAAGLIRTAP